MHVLIEMILVIVVIAMIIETMKSIVRWAIENWLATAGIIIFIILIVKYL